MDSFISDRIAVDKVIDNDCQALLRFKGPKSDKIVELIKECLDSYEIINDKDELAIMVSAGSEYEINNLLCMIGNKGYCQSSSKLLKIG